MPTAYPRAPHRPHSLHAHDDVRDDPYFWMRERANPEVRALLEAENACTETWMSGTEPLRQALYEEIRGRVKEDDSSVPVAWNGYYYYRRTEQDKQYPIHCRRKGSVEAPEEILLDGNALAEGKPYFSLGGMAFDQEHGRLAYTTDTVGDEKYVLRIRDLPTGTHLPDEVPETAGQVLFMDDRSLLYTTLDAAHRPNRVWRHELGSEHDALVFDETDERFTVQMDRTKSRRFLLIESHSHTTTEFRYFDTVHPDAGWRVLLARRQDIEYDVAHQGDEFWLRINDTGKTFRLIRAPLADPSAENWIEVLPCDPLCQIEAQDHYATHVVLLLRDRGQLTLRVLPRDNTTPYTVAMDDEACTVSLEPAPEFASTMFRFHYTSLVAPDSVYDCDLSTGARTLRKVREVPGGYDPAQFVTRRFHTAGADGTSIPVTYVHRRDTTPGPNTPALLYGYGSYGIPMDPAFSSERLSLLDRGFVYAIAHIRGGGDLGKPWHDAGKLGRKANTFSDFITCAEALIDRGFTSASHLAVMGGSAGGLLMGAVLNLRPDLFAAALAKVPFVDVLTTMSDASLPLTIGEYEEWGNPENASDYAVIRGYSPYDNVRAGNVFPALLATAGLNDPRVSYWEPAKWVARLRASKTSDRPILLKTNLGAGHFGASGRYERMKETAFEYAFLLKALAVVWHP